MVLVTWRCLQDTPFGGKNVLFAQFLPSLDIFNSTASAATITFCAGLLDVLQSPTPPTVQFFKSLPEATLLCWGIYVLVLEKDGCRPRIYIGSGTSASRGVTARLRQYDDGFLLSTWVEDALDNAFVIVHKGLLCWCSIPAAALVPIYRLLFVAMEATFSYVFWAVRTVTAADWGMGHICSWDRTTLAYDGLVRHCAPNEAIRGDFHLSEEEREALAAEKEKKAALLKSQNNSSWHYRQMAENYDEYISAAHERKTKSRANNPGLDNKRQAGRLAKAHVEKKYHCVRCNLRFGTRHSLTDHENSPKHKRKLDEENNPYRCGPCNMGLNNKSNLNRHNKTERHQRNVFAAQSSPELD